MTTTIQAEYRIKTTKTSPRPNHINRRTKQNQKFDMEWKQCYKYERLAALRGCGCPHCDPALYDQKQPIFSPLRGLQYRTHDAWDLARMAVSSFNGESSLGQSQKSALNSWCAWLAGVNLSRPGTLDSYGLQIAIGVFSEIFFLGALPPSKLVVNWYNLNANMLGRHLASRCETGPEVIQLNCYHHKLQSSMMMIFKVILHEMIHSYLSRYTCYPWHTVKCATGRCGRSYSVHVGVSGHGRAFHTIAASIEENALRLLGIPLPLGRECANMTEHRRGGYTPCAKDIAQLYNGPNYERLWKWLATTRDDNIKMTGLLLGVCGIPHTRGRRKSDSFLLRSPRLDWRFDE